MLHIRRYEDKDFNDYVATLEKTTSLGEETQSELEAMLNKVNKEHIWVAELNKKAVGFMILTQNTDGSLEVDWLDVHPDFQRKGIGTLLVKKACEVAKEKEFKILSVHTHEKNEKMMQFSIKNGFEMVERIRNFYGEGKDALHLKKRVA